MKLRSFLLAMILCALCVTQTSALEYSFDTPEDYPFGQPTSDGTVYEWEDPNVDRGKDSALIPPGFGTPTSYLPGSGEFLTPNLAAGGSLHGGGVLAGGGAVTLPGVGSYPTTSTPVTAFTDVTKDLYYSNGSLGTLKIPAIDLTVKIYEGTDNKTLAKGAGHFTNTSIWDGNVAFAAHNRGVNNYFGKIHTLEAGDIITLTTRLGNRTYVVASVEKVGVMDTSGTDAAADNRVTLYTCVMNQPEYRGGGTVYAAGVLAERNSHKVTVDGVPVAVEAYVINGSNYFQLRDLGRLLDVGVEWNSATRTVEISTGEGYTEEEPEQTVPKPFTGSVDEDLYDIRVEIVNMTNDLRRQNGLPALIMDDDLMAAAIAPIWFSGRFWNL